MSVWVEKTIGDLGRVVTGKTPSKKEEQYYESGTYPFVSPKDLSKDQFYVGETETRITDKAMDKHRNQVIPRNAILFTCLSFSFGKMAVAKERCITNQQINSIIVNDDHHYLFVYYLLQVYRPFIFSYNSGIDTPLVPKSVFESIKIKCPTLEVQKKIAAVLSAYDDLIENNAQKINRLDKLADEIYKEWFVRFRFPGFRNEEFEKGKPRNWQYVKLSSLVNFSYGFPFKSNRFNSEGIGMPIIRIRNIPNSDTNDFTDEVVDDKYLVNNGDILVGMDGEFHINHWYGETAYLVQRVCKISVINKALRGYIYRAIQAPIKHLESILMGATVGHLGAMHLNDIDILLPSEEVIKQTEQLNSIEEQKLLLYKENKSLKASKKLLLARLISGDISLENLNIEFTPRMQKN